MEYSLFLLQSGVGGRAESIQSLKIRGPYRVDVVVGGHDRGSRPVWVSMPEVSTFFLGVSIGALLIDRIAFRVGHNITTVLLPWFLCAGYFQGLCFAYLGFDIFLHYGRF